MIFTILEATVEVERWGELQHPYAGVDKSTLLAGLLNSRLVQDQTKPKLWKIITFWNNKEDIDAYCKSVEVPAWFLVFKTLGAEPALSISDVSLSK